MRLSKGGQSRSRDSDDAKHVDVKNTVPFIVVVGFNISLSTDSCVVHHDVESTKSFYGIGNSNANTRIVRHITKDEVGAGYLTLVSIKHRNVTTSRKKTFHHGQANSGRATRYDCFQSIKFHCFIRTWRTHNSISFRCTSTFLLPFLTHDV